MEFQYMNHPLPLIKNYGKAKEPGKYD